MRFTASLVTLSLSAGLLAACGGSASIRQPEPLTPLSRWQLRVEPQLDRIALAVHDNGLSANQRSALASLVARARAEQSSEIVIEMPSGDDPATLQMGWAVSEVLGASGVPVRTVAYGAPDPRAPVIVGFARLQAVTHDCSRQWESLTRHANNTSYSGLGCATISNMAAQIADPRDIMGQRPMGPSDAGRRTVVIQSYRRGEGTSTHTSSDSTTVSDAVN